VRQGWHQISGKVNEFGKKYQATRNVVIVINQKLTGLCFAARRRQGDEGLKMSVVLTIQPI